jgi:BNR repeat-like domain
MRGRAVLAAVGACGAALFLAAGAGASVYTAGAPVTVSGPSPFASCTVGAANGSVLFDNAEVEPFVAVNPVNSHLIGVFQQDRWSDGGAHGLVAASSTNGSGWTESWAGFAQCSGAGPTSAYVRASDPWVTFDPAGNAYQISLSFNATATVNAIQVSKSTDGGQTWGAPTSLIQDSDPTGLVFDDKETITADPTRPGYVYAVWDRGDFPSDQRSPSSFGASSYRGFPMFSRTTDGGAHWSTPTALANSNIFTIGNQIAVLPDGDLVDVTKVFQGSGRQPNANSAYEGAFVSTDAGLTWTGPIKIANDLDIPTTDPDNGRPVRAGTDIPQVAVDSSTGRVYVVWADGRFSGGVRDDIALSYSDDGGHKWSTPVRVNQTPNGAQAFNASVAVTTNGTVLVSYYDFRNNDSSSGLPTDVWLAHSHDGGSTWATETHLYGSFDMEKAAVARGYFLGDYQGLAAIGNDALAFFAVTTNVSGNPSDVVAVRATP